MLRFVNICTINVVSTRGKCSHTTQLCEGQFEIGDNCERGYTPIFATSEPTYPPPGTTHKAAHAPVWLP